MKAILISINPKWVAKILNGEKTIEIRKKFPSDYVGWVYIYVTKGKPYIKECDHFRYVGDYEIANKGYYLNGKVVARFWCDKVESLHIKYGLGWETETIKGTQEIEKVTCVDRYNLYDYCKGKAYAIHVTKLEIFDKPKELREFRKHLSTGNCWTCKIFGNGCKTCAITKAPQSWCFVEV